MRASPYHERHLVGVPQSVFIAVGLDCRSAHCGQTLLFITPISTCSNHGSSLSNRRTPNNLHTIHKILIVILFVIVVLAFAAFAVLGLLPVIRRLCLSATASPDGSRGHAQGEDSSRLEIC